MKKSKYDKEDRLWVFMNSSEQEDFYKDTLDRIIANPRFYLDNLDDLDVYRCSKKRKIYKL